MSYYFSLNFKHCRSLGEAMLLANRAIESSYAHLREQIEENRMWIPSLQYSRPEKTEKEKRIANDAWLERLLQMKFIWWPEYKLLALCGSEWPKEVLGMFKLRVDFQNSCDQDYTFATWKGLRSPLKDIVFNCQKGDTETVMKYLNLGREEYPWDLEPEDTADEERFSYFRRSAAYNGIYETLHLDQWLWGKQDDTFIRFTLSALTTPERRFDAQRLLQGYAARRANDLY